MAVSVLRRALYTAGIFFSLWLIPFGIAFEGIMPSQAAALFWTPFCFGALLLVRLLYGPAFASVRGALHPFVHALALTCLVPIVSALYVGSGTAALLDIPLVPVRPCDDVSLVEGMFIMQIPLMAAFLAVLAVLRCIVVGKSRVSLQAGRWFVLATFAVCCFLGAWNGMDVYCICFGNTWEWWEVIDELLVPYLHLLVFWTVLALVPAWRFAGLWLAGGSAPCISEDIGSSG